MRKQHKYFMEFGGSIRLAAVSLHLAVMFAPLFVLAVLAIGALHFAGGDHRVIAASVSGKGIGALSLLGLAGTVAADPAAELTKKLDSLEGEIKTFIQKAEGEIKSTGKVSEETKSALEKQATQAAEIMQRLMAVEQKLATKAPGTQNEVKSIGELVTTSEAYKSFMGGGRSTGRISVGAMHKTALVNATGQNQPLVPAFRRPGIVTPATQPLKIRDVLNAIPIKTNLVEYVEETSYTNSAEMQGAASSPQVYENVAKAESAMAFALKYAPVQTIAHWIPVSKQLLDDAPAIQGYINTRLTYGLKLKEETQILTGDGTSANLKGLITCATAYETTRNVSGDTYIDQISHAITQVKASFYPAEFVVLNPADWEKIKLIKTTGTASSGQYIFADPHASGLPMIWGVPVVESYSMTSGKFLVGASLAATIWDRDDATIEVSREHSDFFVKNMAAILCEERVGLTVEVPKALIYGSFA